MIEAAVSELADAFAKEFSLGLEVAPLLDLDNTWPSVSLLNVLFEPLVGEPATEQTLNLIRGASAYLACLAHETWSTMSEDVSVRIGERGIMIDIRNAPLLPEDDIYEVFVESDLGQIIQQPPEPFPVFGEVSRKVDSDTPFLSLYAIGLVTGLTSFGKGPWSTMSVEDAEIILPYTSRIIAAQCADYYRRLFPDEALGQVAELYLEGVLFPPPMSSEVLPGVQAVESVAAFLNDYEMEPKAARKMFANLSCVPDEALSNLGVIFSCALSPGMPPDIVRRAAFRKGRLMGLLRPAVFAVRRHYQWGDDWLSRNEAMPEDEIGLAFEKRLGMHPWLNMHASRAWQQDCRPFLQACASFDFTAAVYELDKCCQEQPGDIDLRLQRILFYALEADFERVSRECRALSTEPAAEYDPRVYHYWGKAEISTAHFDKGLGYLERAFGYVGKSELEPEFTNAAAVATDYGLALAEDGQFDEALSVLAQAKRWESIPVIPELYTFNILSQLGRMDEATELHFSLLEAAPLLLPVYHNQLALVRESRG